MKKTFFKSGVYLFLSFILLTTGHQVFATSSMSNHCVLGVPKDSSDIVFYLDSVCGDIGDTVSINMKVKGFENIEYIIGKVNFNPNKLQFVDFIKNDEYNIFYLNNYISEVSFVGDGILKYLDDNDTLFTLQFIILGDIGDNIPIYPNYVNLVQNSEDIYPVCLNGYVCVNKPTELLVTSKYCSTSDNSANASLTFKAFGGAAPYNYSVLKAGDTSEIQTGGGLEENDMKTIFGLFSNETYLIKVVDAVSDTFTEKVFIDSNNEIRFEDILRKDDCFDQQEGKLSLFLNNKNHDSHKVEWSNSRYNIDSIEGLAKGDYGVTVSDNASGCQIDTFVQLESEKVWIDSIWVKDATCNGVCDGIAFVDAKQTGNGGIFYKWNYVEHSNYVDSLCSGLYRLVISNENECRVETTVKIGQSNYITVSLDSMTDISSSSSKGAIYVSFDSTNKVFNWNGPDGYFSSNMNIENLDIGGCYTISITDTITHCAIVKTFCISDLTGTISFENSEELKVYPNPAQELITIDFTESRVGEYNVSIMDISGKVLLNKIKPITDNQLNLDVSLLNNGLYILAIKSPRLNTVYKKIVIKF